MAAVSIPNDDVLLEILVRVKDAAALFRCATVCRQWHGLITEPSFLRRRWPLDASSAFVGLFNREDHHGKRHRRSRATIFWEHVFVPVPRSPLGPGRRTLSSFVTNARAGLFDYAVPLVSRHGLVLVDLRVHDTHGYADNSILQLALCNFLLGTCDMLPPLKFSSTFSDCNSNGYAILTDADYRRSKDEPSSSVLPLPSNPSFFKVAIICCQQDDFKYSLHVFSSDKAAWSVHTHCFDTDAQSLIYGPFSDAVVCHGTVHWVYRHYTELYYIIRLNPQTENISLTKLPSEMYYSQINTHPCPTLSVDGALSLAWMQSSGTRVVIWEQQGNKQNVDVTSGWLCTRTIELKLPEKETPGRELCVLREKCGTLLVSDGDDHAYTADLETGMLEEVVDWHHGRSILRSDVMPLEFDWPMIFISRLTR